jgi:hypothetical protein
VCLKQIAITLQNMVKSIVTLKSSVITETRTAFSHADNAFKKLEGSVAELCARTDASLLDIQSKMPPPGISFSPGGKPFFNVKICETKSIANLMPFGEDRTQFRLCHDKFINAISQHVNGSRALFLEMKTQLTNNKNGLTQTEWRIMWGNLIKNPQSI